MLPIIVLEILRITAADHLVKLCTTAHTSAISPATLRQDTSNWTIIADLKSAVETVSLPTIVVADDDKLLTINSSGEWELVTRATLISEMGLALDGDVTSEINSSIATATANMLTSPMTKNFIDGFQIENASGDPTNDITIQPGTVASDDTTPVMITLSAALTKRLDASFAIGDNLGGLDTGSIANDTYHLWAIRNPTTTAVDVLFSASASSPTMPTGFTQKAYLWPIIRESGAIVKFQQSGNYFLLETPGLTTGTTVSTGSRDSIKVAVPEDIKVLADIRAWLYHATVNGYGMITCLAQADIVPSSSLYNCFSPLNYTGFNPFFKLETNTSGEVGFRALNSSTNGGINTIGWTIERDLL